MRPIHYSTCTQCGCVKQKTKEFASKASKSIYLDICKACYTPSRMTAPRVRPVVIERPGVKTRWNVAFYVPEGVGI